MWIEKLTSLFEKQLHNHAETSSSLLCCWIRKPEYLPPYTSRGTDSAKYLGMFQLQSHPRELSFSLEGSGYRQKDNETASNFCLLLKGAKERFHNKEQKSAPLSSYPGEAALAPGFSLALMGTGCTLPRTIVGFSLKMA